MFPRVVATDLDGTLLRGDGSVDPRTRAALRAAQDAGARVVVCTARPVRWMRPIAEALGVGGVAVCANGAVVADLPDGRVIGEFPIDAATALDVVGELRAVLPGATWAVERVDVFGHEPAYRPRWPVPDDTLVDHIEALLAVAPIKLLLRGDGASADALVRSVRETVRGRVEATHSSSLDQLVEMSAAGVSKGSTLAALCARWEVGAAEVIAFGDAPNDLPMLRWAGHGVAVANAHPDVLSGADEVAPSNEDSGPAQVLEALLARG